jgi:hypothetical protein
MGLGWVKGSRRSHGEEGESPETRDPAQPAPQPVDKRSRDQLTVRARDPFEPPQSHGRGEQQHEREACRDDEGWHDQHVDAAGDTGWSGDPVGVAMRLPDRFDQQGREPDGVGQPRNEPNRGSTAKACSISPFRDCPVRFFVIDREQGVSRGSTWLNGTPAESCCAMPSAGAPASSDVMVRDGRPQAVSTLVGSRINTVRFGMCRAWSPRIDRGSVDLRIGRFYIAIATPRAINRRVSVHEAKQDKCQIGVSVHAITDSVSVALNWRLFIPKSRGDTAIVDPGADTDTVTEADAAAAAQIRRRRERCKIPDAVRHREKWRLALDALDQILGVPEAGGWGLARRPVVADRGYGDIIAVAPRTSPSSSMPGPVAESQVNQPCRAGLLAGGVTEQTDEQPRRD